MPSKVEKLVAHLVLLSAIGTLAGCRDYIETLVTDKPVRLSSQWQELPLAPSLRCDRNDQEILLTSALSYEPSLNPLGMRLADGSIARPEAEIVAVDGTTYSLPQLSFWTPYVVLRNGGLPKSTSYKTLRLRSNVPVQISKVSFNCYNLEDVKR